MKQAYAQLYFTIQSYGRLRWLYILTTAGLLSGIFISLPLWSAVRIYPLAPVIHHLSLPDWMHTSLVALLVISLLAAIRYRSYRVQLITLSLLSLALLSLLDITRFQPWVFHYSAILTIYLAGRYFQLSSQKVLDAACILIGGIYFWSGIQKINYIFITETFPWFTQPIWEIAPSILPTVFLTLGLLVPFLEIAIAVGLFFRPTRTVAIYGAFCMMFLVLTSIGPLGHNWNVVVWPWNIVMFLTVLTLFWNSDWSIKKFAQRQKKNLLGWIVFGVFWLLPIGNIFGMVDHYLAWSLYSGRPPEATLQADTIILESLSSRSIENELVFFQWTTNELNVVPYPQGRVYDTVFSQICDRYQNDPSLKLRVKASISYFDTQKVFTTKTCVE
jgi:hypothetical protein